MILLIAGGTHTGKTAFAQKLLKKYSYPYLSIDHLKMGLIRSGYCALAPESDGDSLTRYLWPVAREMIKTAIENEQNLIVEGCYIPFDFQKDFSSDYLRQIRYVCLIFTENYISLHYDEIRRYANVAEARLCEALPPKEALVKENAANLLRCRQYGLDYVLIDEPYEIDWDV